MSQMLFQLETLNVDHSCRTVTFPVVTFFNNVTSDTLEITVLTASEALHRTFSIIINTRWTLTVHRIDCFMKTGTLITFKSSSSA
jgi:hypothetical protein